MRIVNENIQVNTTYTLEGLSKMIETKEIVLGTVIKFNPDEGLIIDLGNNIVGKMQVSNFEDGNSNPLTGIVNKVGKNIMACVEKVDNNIVYLNRAKLQKEYKENELDNLEVGCVFTTTVLSIASFGVFVDMGVGVVGLLPIGDVSIARFSSLRDVFKVGDSVTVVYKGKTDNGYVVSHKELLGTWEENLKDFKRGEYCQGIIREIKSYGAFIEIAPNLTGLADFPENIEIHAGDSVCVMLKSANPEKLKVKLQIISVSEIPYKVKYNYKIKDGVLKEWQYTPDSSIKQIKTVFDGKIII